MTPPQFICVSSLKKRQKDLFSTKDEFLRGTTLIKNRSVFHFELNDLIVKTFPVIHRIGLVGSQQPPTF